MTEEKEEYELKSPKLEKIKGLEGVLVMLFLWSFLMLFAGFLLGAFFMAAGG